MFTLLRKPRWALGAVVVIAASVGFATAGFWQLSRLEERRDRNERVEAARAVPTVSLLDIDGTPPAEYTSVSVVGAWRGDDEVVVPLQSRDGAAGVHLLTPLDTEAGTYLVDRGWVPLDEVEQYPRPTGEVSITATARDPRPGRITSGTEGGRPTVSHRDPDAVGDLAGITMAPVVLDLIAATPNLQPAPLPPLPAALGEGNHLLYAVQWFSFVAIAVIGYVALLRRQIPHRGGSSRRSGSAGRAGGNGQLGDDPHAG
ncbi:MAG: hypothetical protein OES13_02260 [Acidimicrobiia bacterium]|nr:hypothetical protein [Acidimicrobiia bacterium]